MNAKRTEKTDQEFEDELNDCFGEVDICGRLYYAGYALRQISPTTFRCMLANEPEVWQCEECEKTYDDEIDAEICCAEECKDDLLVSDDDDELTDDGDK